MNGDDVVAVIGPNEADKDGMVPARLLADVRVSMKELLAQNVNTWGEVDRLHEQLRGAVEDAEVLARAVSASLTHGEQSPLATALSEYLERHPWSDL